MPRVLLIDECQDLAKQIDQATHTFRQDFLWESNPHTGLELARTSRWDVLILGEGWRSQFSRRGDLQDICARIREGNPLVHILVITTRPSEQDIIETLQMGADEYVESPISTRVISARLLSVVRRMKQYGRVVAEDVDEGPGAASVDPSDACDACRLPRFETPGAAATLSVGDLSMDLNRRQVHVAAVHVPLTQTEFNLLVYLARAPELVARKEDLLLQVLGYSDDVYTASLHSHVNRIRRKLSKAGAESTRITTIWKFGYRLDTGSAA